jgi:RNA polymerase sigma-70 factor (ECF subfamily)
VTDLELARACCAGDEAAWREFRARYFPFIRDFARRFVHQRAAADVADQVIADLWQRKRLAQFDGRSTLKTWLGAVVAHAAINTGKLERRRVPPPANAARTQVAVPGPEDEAARAAFGRLLTASIAALDAEARLLLRLYYEQGLTLERIEPLLGASKATLSRRLQAIRRSLREAIASSARGLDLSRLEFDLAAALEAGVKGHRDDAV